METNGDSQILPLGNTEPKVDAKNRDNQYVYYSFTWNNYDLEILEIVFNVLKHECDWYIIQEELGESGTPHLQGTLKLKRKKRIEQLFKINPNISWRITIKISCMAVYCSRKDKRHGKLWTHNFDIPQTVHVEEPYGWQLEVMDIITKPPHPRHIYWFWEPTGGIGKTELCRYLAVKHKAIILNGKTSDILHVVSKYHEKSNIYIINIPRCTKEHINYQAMELVKDGIFMSGKYDGQMIVIDRPHLIVFANQEPERHRMSLDKWIIKEIKIELE